MEPEAEAASPGSCAPERQLRGPMSDGDDEACCPLCMNELDETDEAVEFCRCGYAMCLWCWHRICGEAAKEGAAARCPNCRTIYDLDAIHQRSVTRRAPRRQLRLGAAPAARRRRAPCGARSTCKDIMLRASAPCAACVAAALWRPWRRRRAGRRRQAVRRAGGGGRARRRSDRPRGRPGWRR